jgi:hypothetical protein
MMARCRLCGKTAKVASVDLAGKDEGTSICVRCAKGRISWLRELSAARRWGSKQPAMPEPTEEEEEAPPPSGMLRLSDLRELAVQSQRSLPPPEAWEGTELTPPSVRAAIRGCDLFPAAPISMRTPEPSSSVPPPPMTRSVPGELTAPAPLRMKHVLNLVIVAVMAASSMVLVLHVLDRRAAYAEGKVALVSAALSGDAVRDAMRPPPTDAAPKGFVPDATAPVNVAVNASTAVGTILAPTSPGSGRGQAVAVPGTGARAETAQADEPQAPVEHASTEAPASGAAPASLADAMAAAVGRRMPAAAAPEADSTHTVAAPASEPAFDTAAARASMRAIAGSLGACKSSPDEEAGSGSVRVTFAPSGAVTLAAVEGGGLSGTPLGSCIANRFRGARVPPFAGSPVTVRQSFTVR